MFRSRTADPVVPAALPWYLEPRANAPRFEYLTMPISDAHSADDFQNMLTDLGAAGWELIESVARTNSVQARAALAPDIGWAAPSKARGQYVLVFKRLA